MTFYYKILPNGLKILVETLPNVQTVAAGIFVKVGSGHEEQKKSGLAHFIEHMSFKGTKKRTAFEIAQAIDRVGGRLNAFTSKEHTCYYSVVQNKHFELALDVTSDIFLNSLYEPKEIALEKNVVLEEIKMYEDTPDEQIHDFLLETAWNGHQMGVSTLGSYKTVAQFKKAALLNFYQNHYQPQNTLLSVCGRIKPKEVFNAVKKYFRNFKRRSGEKPLKAPVFRPNIKYKNKKTEQVHFCLGIKSPDILDNQRYGLSILNTILGVGASSRLFQEIREKRGLVYAISSYLGLFARAGILGVYAGTSPGNFREVVDLVLEELENLRKGPSRKEFQDAQEQIKGSLVIGLEGTASRMNWFAKSILYYDRLISVKETFEKITQVSRDELVHLAERLFNPKNMVLVAIGPFEDSKLKIKKITF